jgi:alkylated DNA repair dioxygenase AlkB
MRPVATSPVKAERGAMTTNRLPQDGEAHLFENAVAEPERVLARLTAAVDWRQEGARIMGRTVPLPRLTAWYGEAGYRYSGVDNPPQPWLDDLLPLKATAERLAGVSFNSVLLNLYRDGSDSVSWHRDAEAALGPDPTIASLSLGAVRRFKLRHRRDRGLSVNLDLPPGSCLVMGPGSQVHWLHALPKTAKPVGPRLNLTFRRVVAPARAR